jgi:hypothetical protein
LKPGVQVARRPFLNQQVYKPNQFGNSQHQAPPVNQGQWTSSTSQNRFSGQQNQNGKQFYTSNQEQIVGGKSFVWKIVGFTDCSSSCAGGKNSWISESNFSASFSM